MQFVEIVAVFKSLISSRPGDGLLINDLERDFEKVIGDRLPFGDFGYSSVVDLIKRGMKDDFLVVGDDRNARVEIVNADKLKHIAAYTANVEKNKNYRKHRNENQNRNYQYSNNQSPSQDYSECPKLISPQMHQQKPKNETVQWLAQSMWQPMNESMELSTTGSSSPPRLTKLVVPLHFPFPPPPILVKPQICSLHNSRTTLPQKSASSSSNSAEGSKRSQPKYNYLNKQVLSTYLPGFHAINIHVIYSPEEFYFYFKSTIFYLTPIIEEMNKYYQQNSDNYTLNSKDDLRISNIYVILFKQKYHRARFQNFLNNSFEFLLSDYGFLVEVPHLNEIFSIKYDYIKYPPIIFRGKLGNIRPVNGEKWTRKAQELFFESVSDCLVWADIKEVQERRFTMEVILPDTEEKMTEVLAQAGLAKIIEKT